jgi:hypothetical protein
MELRKLLLACAVVACTLPVSGQAQIVRDDGVKAIAGILVPGAQEVVEWTFKSGGGEILFATLDAEIYRIRTDEHQTEPLAVAGEGCSDEGGPGMFYLEVAGEADGAVLCRAEKPLPPPGWQRDPRMACMLPASKGQTGYLLRVGLKPSEEIAQPYYPFLLNLSIRGIAASGINIRSAAAQSSIQGFSSKEHD